MVDQEKLVGGFTVANEDIKKSIRLNHLFRYEVASEIGISECTFCVWLRRELDQEKKQEILRAIQRLAEKEGHYERD